MNGGLGERGEEAYDEAVGYGRLFQRQRKRQQPAEHGKSFDTIGVARAKRCMKGDRLSLPT